jgi:uncharacterized protein (TIGR00255 family)
MISSMTGFGQAELTRDGSSVSVELTSLNNRFFEIQIKLPKRLAQMEPRVRELINERVKRGKVICLITVRSESATDMALTVNEPMAEMYVRLGRKLRDKLSLAGDMTIPDLLALEGVLEPEEADSTSEKCMALVQEAISAGLSNLVGTRHREGERLAADMRPRLDLVAQSVERIRLMSRDSVSLYRDRLEARIRELLTEATNLSERIAMEAAVMAERSDVTEECVRIDSHLEQFAETLDDSDPSGKRLSFILQELNREANTIGSKSISSIISTEVIFLKGEIEKLREQVQNIE